MREENVNRRITNSIEEIPVESLRKYLKNRIRFERSKMDRAQPYFKNSYQDATAKFAPDDPSEFEDYDAESLTQGTSDARDSETREPQSEPIQIHEVRIQNWRQYGGEQSVDLSATDDRLINIIEGQNGAGKSNFLNAITLCLYGKQVHEQAAQNDLQVQPFVTLSRLEEADVGQSVSGFIEVVLGMSDPEYLFRREFETEMLEDGTYDDSLGDLELRRMVDGEWKRTDNPSSYLNQVLPAHVSDYFLFDGEDLDVFFEEGYTERVEDAILDVSHLELLNRATDHFEKVQSEMEREASDVEGEVGELRSELDAVEDELQERRHQLSETEATIAETKDHITYINDKLMDASDEYVQRLVERLEEQKERVTQLEAQRAELQTDIKDILIEVGPMIYAAEALLDASDNLEGMRDAASLPPKIQRRFISELIQRGECICGRPVEAHSESEQHLEDLRESVFDVSEAQIEDLSIIPTLFESTSDQIDLLVEKRQEAARIEDEIDELKQEIKNTQHELDVYEIPDIDTQALENNRQGLEDELEKLHKRHARIQVDIEELEEQYNKLQEELQTELKKQKEHVELLAQLALVRLAKDCLRHIRDGILEDIRSRTEANINEYFNQLIWKDEEYTIELTEEYSLLVLDEYGENKIGSLSAGETQVLALSFMAALSQISGFDAPVVIDTPLGRISSTPKRFIAENLPKYMEKTQITFLMTDEEYTAEVRDIMEEAVGREYRLVYQDTETTIVERDEIQEVNV